MIGGGTDLRTGFAKALRTRPRPDVVVVGTDGRTPWPDSRPACRTVVGPFPRAGRELGRGGSRLCAGRAARLGPGGRHRV